MTDDEIIYNQVYWQLRSYPEEEFLVRYAKWRQNNGTPEEKYEHVSREFVTMFNNDAKNHGVTPLALWLRNKAEYLDEWMTNRLVGRPK